MRNIFQTKSMRCVVIASGSGLRQLLSGVLKELEYPNLVIVADIKSSIEIIETEEVGWIIGPLVDDNGQNMLQVLDLINQQQSLRSLKVSILRNDDDRLLPQAFALGAFSCHRIVHTRDSCYEEFSSLITQLKFYEGDFTRVAAGYLRRLLLEMQEYDEIKKLSEGMAQAYPADDTVQLDLAESYLLSGETERGKTLLHLMTITAPQRIEQIKSISQKFFNSPNLPGDARALLASQFGLESCLIVEPRAEALEKLREILSRIGFKVLACFRDPVTAISWLRSNPKPNLILSQWTLPTLPGPVFLYKLRQRLGHEIPLIVLHTNIEERQAPMLAELGASRLVQEPYNEKILFDDIIWTIKQASQPSEAFIVRQHLINASKRRDIPEVKRLLSAYRQLPAVLESDLLIVDAIIAYDTSCFIHAKKHALEAMQKGGDSRLCMEILGKSLMAMREFDIAIRCFENVSFIAPLNVAHICSLAECRLEEGDDIEFDQLIEKARAIDQDNEKIQEVKVKGAIKRGQSEAARRLMSGLKTFKEVLSFMNNRAVTLMRVGDFQEGLDLYLKTLDSLPEGQVELKALVQYNLGLGYARVKRFEEAQEALAKAEQTRQPERRQKARSLRLRVLHALKTGGDLILKGEATPSVLDEQAKLAQIQEIEQALSRAKGMNRSDFCLIRIYITDFQQSELNATLERRLSFNPRGKLVKNFHKGLIIDDAS